MGHKNTPGRFYDRGYSPAKTSKWLLYGVCAFTILVVGLLFFSYSLHTIIKIETVKDRIPVFCSPVDDGEEFVISFVHSVNKRPVFDTIRVEKDHFLIVKSRYDAFGAGMPETSLGDMQLRIAGDGWLELTGINRAVPDLNLFVGTVANHSLYLRSGQYSLDRMVAPGTSVRISLDTISTYELMRGRCAP